MEARALNYEHTNNRVMSGRFYLMWSGHEIEYGEVTTIPKPSYVRKEVL
jgi:hypothetical protein